MNAEISVHPQEPITTIPVMYDRIKVHPQEAHLTPRDINNTGYDGEISIQPQEPPPIPNDNNTRYAC